MPEQRASTVTFAFTDIEGSTALVKQLRERWPEVPRVRPVDRSGLGAVTVGAGGLLR
jgi:hypothetical protein